jgi:tRNA(Ile)-lysidine synthase
MLDLTDFRSFIKQHALLKPQDRVLLAVSGGRDSVLMAHYFHQAGYNFGIAHCNFKLREAEADREEQFTSALAESLEVPFFSTSFHTQEYAAEKRISIQMAARDLRYQWLEEIRVDFAFDHIALAHHQNDSVETILLNLTRGTGIAGLHGILPKRGKLIRPLLFLNRTEIDEIVHREKFHFCEDSSNSSSKYARNKLRLQVIPILKELNPKLEETFKANAARFAELESLLQQQVDQLKKNIFIPLSSEEIAVQIHEIKKLKPLRTLVFGLFNPYGFSEAVLDDLLLKLDGQAGKIFESPSHLITIDRQRLILSPRSLPGYTVQLIRAEEKGFTWNNSTFRQVVLPASAFRRQTANSIVQLDYKLLIFPLKLRTWQKGDYFYPLGMNGRKKLSDYFIEQKIPLQHKQNIGVLENGNGDILWIAGYRPDERYKITEATENIFILEKLIPNGTE